MAEGGHFEKNGRPKSLWARYLMNRGLDHNKICCAGSMGISDDLINFWEKIIKHNMADGHKILKK